MKSKNNGTNKHLTIEQRKEIEACLDHGVTFKAIAKRIEKDPTTVSYEVKHHRKEYRNAFVRREDGCPTLLKAPYVCNGCQKRHSKSCPYVRFLYRAVEAQEEYKTLLTDAREGIPLNKESFYADDRIITAGLRNGQHLCHIQANNSLHASKSTIYRHFHKGYYSASIVDLPRAVKFKPRKSPHSAYVPAGIKVGRSFDDFNAFMEEKQLESCFEMDTVIGRPGGKVILTMIATNCNFMFGLLLDNKTAVEAASRFADLKARLRSSGFSPADIMPVILTDNGCEFADVFSFENDDKGQKELSVFFCDPMHSSQKPHVEKNHTLFRDIVPKGKSFDDFSQETVNLIFSHVNAVSRTLYSGKSAYDMFSFMYPDGLAACLGIQHIPADKVCQSPRLLLGIADLNKGL